MQETEVVAILTTFSEHRYLGLAVVGATVQLAYNLPGVLRERKRGSARVTFWQRVRVSNLLTWG